MKVIKWPGPNIDTNHAGFEMANGNQEWECEMKICGQMRPCIKNLVHRLFFEMAKDWKVQPRWQKIQEIAKAMELSQNRTDNNDRLLSCGENYSDQGEKLSGL